MLTVLKLNFFNYQNIKKKRSILQLWSFLSFFYFCFCFHLLAVSLTACGHVACHIHYDSPTPWNSAGCYMIGTQMALLKHSNSSTFNENLKYIYNNYNNM